MAAVGPRSSHMYVPAAKEPLIIPVRKLLGEGAEECAFWVSVREGRFEEAGQWLDSLRGNNEDWAELGRKVVEDCGKRNDSYAQSAFLEILFRHLLEHDLIVAAQVASLARRTDLLGRISDKFIKLNDFKKARDIFSEVHKQFPNASAFHFFHMLTRLAELGLPSGHLGEFHRILSPFDPHLLDWVRAALRNQYLEHGYPHLAKEQNDKIIDPGWKSELFIPQ